MKTIQTRLPLLWLQTAWRALGRDWRAGELRFLFLALVVASVAVTCTGFLSDRVQQAFAHRSAQMVGGDVVLQANDPMDPAIMQAARERGLALTQGNELSTMISTPQAMRLVSLKVVDEAYPLLGSLRVDGFAQAGQGGQGAGAPPPGSVWVDAQLLALLDIGIGAQVQLGERLFTAAGVIVQEPDRGVQFINMSPRVMMHREDLAATGLTGPFSRMRHTLALTGQAGSVRDFQNWFSNWRAEVTSDMQAGMQAEQQRPVPTVVLPGQTRPEVQRSLQRVQQFLVLAALLAVVLAAVALALAARQFYRRHESGFAVMRSFGASRGQLGSLLMVEFLLFGLLCAALGAALGFGLQELLARAVAHWFDITLPAASWTPVWQSLASCCLLLLGFAMPALLDLLKVAPMQVLRQQEGARTRQRWPGWLCGFAAFALLSWWVSGDARLSLLICLAFGGWLALLMGLAYGAMRTGGHLAGRLDGSSRRHATQGSPLRGSGTWPGMLRWIVLGLGRRRWLAAVQVGSLSIGLMVLLLLMLIRTDLLAGWRNTVPADAPNTFLVNVQTDQTAALGAWFAEHDLQAQPLVPMVRGRLLAVNGVAAESRRYVQARARRLVAREFNLSYQARLPDSNRIVAALGGKSGDGRWLDVDKPEVSLEIELAQTLDIALGDDLTFDVAGQTVDVRVTSLREVKWDSFDVNFFALMSPVVLADAPATWITALHLPPERAHLGRDLLARFPNLTIIDVGVMLNQVRDVIEQGSQAVQLLFVFTVAAGLLVLGVSFVATRQERRHEVALMRALGANGGQLRRLLYGEMLALGLLAGLLAAAGSMALAFVLAVRVFDFTPVLSLWPLWAGALAGMAAAVFAGGLTLHGVLRVSPMRVLRQV